MDQSYNIVRSVISWCQENLSPPVIKRRSVMKVMVFRETGGDYGYYCDQNNWLVINLDVTPNIRMLIRSTIHEYTHSLQNLKEYSLMNKQVGMIVIHLRLKPIIVRRNTIKSVGPRLRNTTRSGNVSKIYFWV